MGGRILKAIMIMHTYPTWHTRRSTWDSSASRYSPNMLPKVKEVLNGRGLEVCAVVSYPHGNIPAGAEGV